MKLFEDFCGLFCKYIYDEIWNFGIFELIDESVGEYFWSFIYVISEKGFYETAW